MTFEQPEGPEPQRLPEGLPQQVRAVVEALHKALSQQQPHALLLEQLNGLEQFQKLADGLKGQVIQYLQKSAGDRYRVVADRQPGLPDAIRVITPWRYEGEAVIGSHMRLFALAPATPNAEPPAGIPAAVVKAGRAIATAAATRRSAVAVTQQMNALPEFRALTEAQLNELRPWLQRIVGSAYFVRLEGAQGGGFNIVVHPIDSVSGDFLWQHGNVEQQQGNALILDMLARRLFQGGVPIERAGQGFTLTDCFDYVAALERDHALRVVQAVAKRGATLANSPNDRRLLTASHARLTHAEVFSRSCTQYMEMVRQYENLYERCRADGVPVDRLADQHKQALDHLTAFRSSGAQLVEHYLECFRTARRDNRNAVEWAQSPDGVQWRKRRDDLENAVWRHVTMRQAGAPENQVSQPPPVHRAMIGLINARYVYLLEQANKESDGKGAAAKQAAEVRIATQAANRVRFANSRITKIVQGLGGEVTALGPNSQIRPSRGNPPSDANYKRNEQQIRKAFTQAALNTQFPAEAGWADRNAVYTYDSYLADIKQANLPTSQRARFEVFGRENVVLLAQWTNQLAQWQTSQARLSAIRHHFAQLYRYTALGDGPVSKEFQEKEHKAHQEFLQKQTDTSLKALAEHFERVEKNVINQGLDTTLEQFWNSNARDALGSVANRLVQLWTAFIPNFGGLQDNVRQNLIGNIPNLLGWPRYTEAEIKALPPEVVKLHGLRAGMIKRPEHLDDDDRKRLEEHRKSINSAIETFNKSGVFENARGSISAVRQLVAPGFLNSEELLQLAAEEQADRLQSGPYANQRITDAWLRTNWAGLNVQQKRQVTIRCFEQLTDDIAAYGTAYEQMLTEMHAVIGVHIDFEREFADFAGRMTDYTLMIVLAALGIVGAVALIYKLRHRIYAWRMEKKIAAKDARIAAQDAEINRLRSQGARNLALEAEVAANRAQLVEMRRDLGRFRLHQEMDSLAAERARINAMPRTNPIQVKAHNAALAEWTTRMRQHQANVVAFVEEFGAAEFQSLAARALGVTESSLSAGRQTLFRLAHEAQSVVQKTRILQQGIGVNGQPIANINPADLLSEEEVRRLLQSGVVGEPPPGVRPQGMFAPRTNTSVRAAEYWRTRSPTAQQAADRIVGTMEEGVRKAGSNAGLQGAARRAAALELSGTVLTPQIQKALGAIPQVEFSTLLQSVHLETDIARRNQMLVSFFRSRLPQSLQGEAQAIADLLLHSGVCGETTGIRTILRTMPRAPLTTLTPRAAPGAIASETIHEYRAFRRLRMAGGAAGRGGMRIIQNPVGPVLAGVNIALTGQELADALQEQREMMALLEKSFVQAGLRRQMVGNRIFFTDGVVGADGQLTSGTIRIEMSQVTPSARTTSAGINFGVAIAAGGVELLAVAAGSAAAGPVGLCIAGVVLAVYIGTEAYQRGDAFRLIGSLPPFILALSPEQYLGPNPQSLMKRGFLDLGRNVPIETRRRIAFAFFCAQMRERHPERYQAMILGRTAQELNEFYESEFTTRIAPVYTAFLCLASRQDSNWDDIRDFLVDPNIIGSSPVDEQGVRDAAVNAGNLWFAHLAMEEYAERWRFYFSHRDRETPQAREALRLTHLLSNQEYFGRRLISWFSVPMGQGQPSILQRIERGEQITTPAMLMIMQITERMQTVRNRGQATGDANFFRFRGPNQIPFEFGPRGIPMSINQQENIFNVLADVHAARGWTFPANENVQAAQVGITSESIRLAAEDLAALQQQELGNRIEIRTIAGNPPQNIALMATHTSAEDRGDVPNDVIAAHWHYVDAARVDVRTYLCGTGDGQRIKQIAYRGEFRGIEVERTVEEFLGRGTEEDQRYARVLVEGLRRGAGQMRQELMKERTQAQSRRWYLRQARLDGVYYMAHLNEQGQERRVSVTGIPSSTADTIPATGMRFTIADIGEFTVRSGRFYTEVPENAREIVLDAITGLPFADALNTILLLFTPDQLAGMTRIGLRNRILGSIRGLFDTRKFFHAIFLALHNYNSERHLYEVQGAGGLPIQNLSPQAQKKIKQLLETSEGRMDAFLNRFMRRGREGEFNLPEVTLQQVFQNLEQRNNQPQIPTGTNRPAVSRQIFGEVATAPTIFTYGAIPLMPDGRLESSTADTVRELLAPEQKAVMGRQADAPQVIHLQRIEVLVDRNRFSSTAIVATIVRNGPGGGPPFITERVGIWVGGSYRALSTPPGASPLGYLPAPQQAPMQKQIRQQLEEHREAINKRESAAIGVERLLFLASRTTDRLIPIDRENGFSTYAVRSGNRLVIVRFGPAGHIDFRVLDIPVTPAGGGPVEEDPSKQIRQRLENPGQGLLPELSKAQFEFISFLTTGLRSRDPWQTTVPDQANILFGLQSPVSREQFTSQLTEMFAERLAPSMRAFMAERLMVLLPQNQLGNTVGVQAALSNNVRTVIQNWEFYVANDLVPAQMIDEIGVTRAMLRLEAIR